MLTSPVCRSTVRSPAFNLGLLLGVGFSGVGLACILLASRVPHLDQFASEGNFALAVVFVLLGLVPTCRFVKSPRRSFFSGITAWVILTAVYSVTELGFPRLATRLSAFHLFILGWIVFVPLAGFAWVMNVVILSLRRAGMAS